VEVVASLSQGRTAAAQYGLFTQKSVPVIFEPPCTILVILDHGQDLPQHEIKKRLLLLLFRYLFSYVLIQTYQGSSGRVWRLQNKRENHSHCEICRWTCVTG